MMIKMMNRMIKLMMLTSSMNLYDLPPPRLKRESILTHHEAEHHQGEDLARVGLMIMMRKGVMWTMMNKMLMMMLIMMKTLVEATPISGPAFMWIPQWLSLLIVEPTVFVTPDIIIIIMVIHLG